MEGGSGCTTAGDSDSRENPVLEGRRLKSGVPLGKKREGKAGRGSGCSNPSAHPCPGPSQVLCNAMAQLPSLFPHGCPTKP